MGGTFETQSGMMRCMRLFRISQLKWFLVGAATYFLVSSLIAQQPFEYHDPILKKNGIEYAITGVAETKQDPRWRTFPLKLEFATMKGELYSDVHVRIYTPSQKLVFDVKVDAPWLLVRLKPGTYYVYVTDTAGRKKSVTADVPASGQIEYTLKW